jgi:hypothetical protein
LLPILKRLKESGIAGTIIKNRTPDESSESETPDSKEECAKEVLRAIKADDHMALADALEELFHIADEAPHKEGPHIEPHSYQAQNQKAGQE